MGKAESAAPYADSYPLPLSSLIPLPLLRTALEPFAFAAEDGDDFSGKVE